MTTGEAFRRCRNAFGYTQKYVAKELNIFPQVYQKYESNQTTPSVKVLLSLVNLYDVSADYLLGLSDVPRPIKENQEKADALTIAAENGNLQDFYENLAHKLAQQGIKL